MREKVKELLETIQDESKTEEVRSAVAKLIDNDTEKKSYLLSLISLMKLSNEQQIEMIENDLLEEIYGMMINRPMNDEGKDATKVKLYNLIISKTNVMRKTTEKAFKDLLDLVNNTFVWGMIEESYVVHVVDTLTYKCCVQATSERMAREKGEALIDRNGHFRAEVSRKVTSETLDEYKKRKSEEG